MKENRHAELVSASANIEAPYELPEGWKWCRLGDVIETSKEKTDTFSSEMKYVGLEHIDSNGKINGWISADDVKSLKNIFHPNQILYGKLRPYLNKHDIVDFTGVCSTDILVFNAKTDCSNKYINYFFNLPYFIDFAVSNSKGINLPRVSEKIVLDIPFPLPPTLTEQQRIVNRIETMFAKLDQAQEKAQAVLDSFETRKAAILHKAFTGELTANWRKENGVADDSWEEKTLGEMTRILSSKRIFKEEYVETGVPFYRSTEIVELNDFGTTNPQIFITKERYKEIKEKYGVPEVGDLLVTSVGTIGKTWIVDDRPFYYKDGNLTQVKKCALLNMQFLDKFIKSSYFINHVFDTVAGTAYNALTIAKFSKIIIPVPTLPEQQEIVRILDTVLEKEFRAKEVAQTVLDQIALLKKSILARAFRGEI